VHNQQLLSQYVAALESSALCARLDAQGRVVFISESLQKQLHTDAAVIGTRFTQFIDPSNRDQLTDRINYAIEFKQSWNGIVRLMSANNKGKDSGAWFKCLTIPLFENEQLSEIVLLLQDISREVYLDELLNETRFDAVTGLATRVDLLNDLKKARAQCLAILDIRKFRSFVDFYGLEFGDQLLRAFSNWSAQYLSESRLNIYRLYGDKFAIAADFRMIPNLFEVHLQQYYDALANAQFTVDGGDVEIDIALGMGVGSKKLIQLAESALSKAKKVFSGYQIECVKERDFSHSHQVNWMPKIQAALDNDNFINYYQPIKSSNGQHVDYYEALVRLRDGKNDLPPGLFLDKAKTTRYYSQITRSVVQQAMVQSERHQVAISVNVSIEDILNPQTVEFILTTLDQHPAAQLIFEITETESTEDFSAVEEFAQQVRQRGAKIAIDDFGVGYSNFSRLIQLHPDYLKIDGSIIKNILEDKSNASILNGMISICRELNIPMVAEFVENEAINGYLTQQQIEYLQGYYIGRPAPHISQWLN
jgi:EAL domain-containing protein (putative c-di-GMP-specific phosphodiesterase class I)/GGDEF domain-containing protein